MIEGTFLTKSKILITLKQSFKLGFFISRAELVLIKL